MQTLPRLLKVKDRDFNDAYRDVHDLLRQDQDANAPAFKLTYLQWKAAESLMTLLYATLLDLQGRLKTVEGLVGVQHAEREALKTRTPGTRIGRPRGKYKTG